MRTQLIPSRASRAATRSACSLARESRPRSRDWSPRSGSARRRSPGGPPRPGRTRACRRGARASRRRWSRSPARRTRSTNGNRPSSAAAPHTREKAITTAKSTLRLHIPFLLAPKSRAISSFPGSAWERTTLPALPAPATGGYLACRPGPVLARSSVRCQNRSWPALPYFRVRLAGRPAIVKFLHGDTFSHRQFEVFYPASALPNFGKW